MTTLNDSLLRLVEEQLIEPEEAYVRAADKAGIEASLKQRGLRVDSKG